MALIPAGERPTETGAKSAAKIGRRELAIRIRGVRAFVAVKYLVDMSGINKT